MEIHLTCRNKSGASNASTLIDQPVFQRQYGENLTALAAARELVFKVYDDWTAAAAATGSVSLEVKAQARLAACWATEVAHKAAQFAFNSPLARMVCVIAKATTPLPARCSERHADRRDASAHRRQYRP